MNATRTRKKLVANVNGLEDSIKWLIPHKNNMLLSFLDYLGKPMFEGYEPLQKSDGAFRAL